MKTLILITLIAYTTFSTAQITTTFVVEGLTCTSCANTATKVLREISGVDSAFVDFETKHAIVLGTATLAEIKNAIKEYTNFEVLFEGDSLTKPLLNYEKENLDIKTIKGGQKINFKKHLSSGKVTIFDFYADWCGPCRVFSPKVEHFIKEHPTVALRKVDIVDWNSDLSKQLTKDYKMPALPFSLIFNDQGMFLGKVEGNNIEKVSQIIQAK